jgi:oligopeptidase A
MSNDVNPLLKVQFRVPFDRIRAEHVRPAMDEHLRQARARLDELARDNAPRTWENTMAALDELTEPLDWAMAVVRHLEAVATYPELRAAHNDVEPEVSAFYTSIPLNEGLWKNIKAYAAAPEAASLTGTRARFLQKTIETFRRHGADLDAAGKKRLEEIDVELTQLTTKFGENVLDSTNAFELIIENEADLAGLPPTAIQSARESAARKQRPGWRFTLHAPDYFAIMTYLDNADIRRQVYSAYSVRGTEGEWDNRPILSRILELRAEKARI